VTAGGTGRTLGGREAGMSSGTGEKVGTLGGGSAGNWGWSHTRGGVKLAGVDAVRTLYYCYRG
jgi:hypothetical protein